MKAEANKLEDNSKNKNIREICKGNNGFKKGYQPRAYVIKNDDGTIAAVTTSIPIRWKQFYSNLLHVNQSTSHEGSEIYIEEPDVPELGLSEVECAIEN